MTAFRQLLVVIFASLSMVLATVTPSPAAVSVTLGKNRTTDTIWASASVTNNSAKAVCVALWVGYVQAGWNFQWSPVRFRCTNRASSSTITSIGSGSYYCGPGIYYGEVRLYSTSNPDWWHTGYTSSQTTSKYDGTGC